MPSWAANSRENFANVLTSGAHLGLLFVGFHIGTRAGWISILCLISAISFAAWIANYRRYRLIGDTATSKIGSAAQGYVEICGRSKHDYEEPLFAHLSRMPCIWYRYIIEEKQSNDKGYTYHEGGVSENIFTLTDNTGECIVDPDNAEVITTHKRVWYEQEFRYTEYLLLASDTIYALGEFTTLSNATAPLDEREDINQLLAEWKRNTAELKKRFDLNQDGEIDLKEWELARLQAKREIQKEHREIRLRADTSIIHRPSNGRLFLLSNLKPDKLAQKYAFWGGFHLSAFFIGGAFATYLLVT